MAAFFLNIRRLIMITDNIYRSSLLILFGSILGFFITFVVGCIYS